LPEGLGRFQKKRLGNSDDQILWNAIEHIERHLSLLPGTPAVQLDEATGGVSSQDGTPLDFGGGGDSGGGGGGGNHGLLSPSHIDTDPADPVEGDLIYATGGLWSRLAIGTTGFILKVVAGIPAWATFAHNLLNGSEHGDTAAGTVVAGDLVYGNNTPKWDRLPKGTDGHVLTLASGLPSWAASGSGKSIISGWIRDNIDNAGTSDGIMPRAGGAESGSIGLIMPYAGTVYAVSVLLDSDVGGVGDNYTVTIYKNGVATAITATITGGAGTETSAYATHAGVSFSAGDTLAIYDKETGTISTANAQACIVIALN